MSRRRPPKAPSLPQEVRRLLGPGEDGLGNVDLTLRVLAMLRTAPASATESVARWRALFARLRAYWLRHRL